MKFFSTRGNSAPLSFSDALQQGLAPDGGLYIPETWPAFNASDFDGAQSLAQVAEILLAPFLVDDPLAPELSDIVSEAFNFLAPLRALPAAANATLSVLELHHGPTAAFKDFGARFLAACFSRLRSVEASTLNILVATSGDTGGAVAAAFHRRPHIEVTVLFPRGLVSPTQERQLTCWGDNVRSFAVEGSFDDCQRLVKAAFLDTELRAHRQLSSANSINLGRLLPQMVYYAMSSLEHWRTHQSSLNFIIPSGNLGNAAACVWTRRLGLPIGEIVLGHNANKTVPDYLISGLWRPRPSVATLASAMDVGNPSNMERLQTLWPDVDHLRQQLRAFSVTDEQIRTRIRHDYQFLGQIWCPHTAVAAEVWHQHIAQTGGNWCLVATASPAKFPEIVEPLIGVEVPVPVSLAELLDRPTHVESLSADMAALRSALMTSEG
ncbi:MAG: threonine synthase [Steroidobacteraceae bacterium]